MLAEHVRAGRPADQARIGAAPNRILRDSRVARCYVATIRPGVLNWRVDDEALDYGENLFAGRDVLTTPLAANEALAADVFRHYRMLQAVERRFRVT